MDCQGCAAPFEGKRSDAVYCSERCRSNAANRRYAQRHPDRIAANRLTQNGKAAKRMLSRVKSRAKRLGILFDLSLLDIDIPTYCPVLGILLVLHQGKRGYWPDSPSLDRMKPKFGYVRGNVRVISARANLLKNNATVTELELVLDDLKRRDVECSYGTWSRTDFLTN